ncbi:hypothetical protein ACQKFG_26870 [Peribacillus sp. NPDC076916]|uniref:hypothetical protein n=1 Tax=Peribacillus sp. NPDC076916 TaxID=3390608 RepID=UPI003D017323
MNVKFLAVSTVSIIAFLSIYFSGYTAYGNAYIAFALCLILSLIPLVWSVIQLFKKDIGAIIFLIISAMLLLFTLFMFLTPEAGNPPELFR